MSFLQSVMPVSKNEPIACLNGRFVPLSEAKLPVSDMGIVHAAAVAEMVRTFAHQPFRLDDHLDRLFCGLRVLGLEDDVDRDDLQGIIEHVLAHNTGLIDADDDLGMIIFVTAGSNPTYLAASGGSQDHRPSVGVHTFRLPFQLWAEKVRQGQSLIVSQVRQVPAASVDPRIKSRSRLHWFLADREARRQDPQAAALVLDGDGFVAETSSGSLFIVRNGRLATPRAENTLAGISRQVVFELAESLGLSADWADLTPDDVLAADEVFLCSTPYCLMPVARLNGKPIGDGESGSFFRRLSAVWNERVGFDIIGQIVSRAGKPN
ncbi:MAG: aminotransferase class IV [Planctomycetes bacterium]|nr:aminotransferase class IV [Planctomycetota bacterium]